MQPTALAVFEALLKGIGGQVQSDNGDDGTPALCPTGMRDFARSNIGYPRPQFVEVER